MSEASSLRRVLHLVVEGAPARTAEKVTLMACETPHDFEVFTLTETNAREALEKIFAADTVAVWSDV